MASIVSGYIGQINPGDGTNYAIGSTAYGVCDSAADAAAKTVDMTGFKLIQGATIHVKFTNGNSASDPTLNVNGTGAKNIAKAAAGTDLVVYTIPDFRINKGQVVTFTYSSGAWMVATCEAEGYNDKYAECSTAASTAAKQITIPGTSLRAGLTVYVKFTYTNTATDPTLGLNGGAGKTIYLYGTTKVGTQVANSWSAGQIVSFTYDGTAWYMNGYHQGIVRYSITGLTPSMMPLTINSSLITNKHVLLNWEFPNPDVQFDEWTVTTSNGSFTISGTLASNVVSTSLKLTLGPTVADAHIDYGIG